MPSAEFQIRVVDDDASAERLDGARQLASDPAVPHEPEAELRDAAHRAQTLEAPTAAPDLGVRLRDLAHQRQDERERVGRDLLHGVVGNVRDGHADRAGGGHIHVVHADPIARHDPAPRQCAEGLGIDGQVGVEHGVRSGRPRPQPRDRPVRDLQGRPDARQQRALQVDAREDLVRHDHVEAAHAGGMTGNRTYEAFAPPVSSVTVPPKTAGGRSSGSSCVYGPTPLLA